MKYGFLKVVLSIIFISVLIMSCSSNEDEEHIRNYNGKLLDALSGDPIPGVTIRLDENFGGQFILDTDKTVTNTQGIFDLQVSINDAAVDILLDEYMFDSTVLWQGIYLESMEYLAKSKEQGGEKFPPFRAKIVEDELITIDAWKCGILNLNFIDTINTELYGSTTVEFRSKDPDEEYLYRIGNYDNQSDDWEILIPSDIPVIMYWETFEGPSFDMTELVRVDSVELNFDFKETQDFILYH